MATMNKTFTKGQTVWFNEPWADMVRSDVVIDIIDDTVVTTDQRRLHKDSVYSSKEEAIAEENRKSQERIKDYKAQIKDTNDLLNFMLSNTVAHAAEYTDYEARTAAIARMQELGFKLTPENAQMSNMDALCDLTLENIQTVKQDLKQLHKMYPLDAKIVPGAGMVCVTYDPTPMFEQRHFHGEYRTSWGGPERPVITAEDTVGSALIKERVNMQDQMDAMYLPEGVDKKDGVVRVMVFPQIKINDHKAYCIVAYDGYEDTGDTQVQSLMEDCICHFIEKDIVMDWQSFPVSGEDISLFKEAYAKGEALTTDEQVAMIDKLSKVKWRDCDMSTEMIKEIKAQEGLDLSFAENIQMQQ